MKKTIRKLSVIIGVFLLCFACQPEEKQGNISKLSDHVFIYHGPTNVGIIRDGENAILIDCGEGSVANALPGLGIKKVSQLWFTHHHRDMACGAFAFVAQGAKVCVPVAEKAYFDNVSAYWQNPKNRWNLYDHNPHHLMLAEQIHVDTTVAEGQSKTLGTVKITAMATPGHTDGSMSYLVEVDGKRLVFSGDAIYDKGQIWEMWSLQKPAKDLWSYFAFLGSRRQLEQSLRSIEAVKPDMLVPSHGQVMKNPIQAMDLLIQRLDNAYEQFAAISSLRRHEPKILAEYSGKKGQMPFRSGKPVPACLKCLDSTGAPNWVLVSQDKAAFVIDCGFEHWGHPLKTIQAMLVDGEIKSVEGLWITHYHDDHVDGIPAFQKAFPDVPCITDHSVAQIISNPIAWRLPCLSQSQARVDKVTKDGESWMWHEFKMTAYHFPGQTLYHAGLLVEGQGVRILLAGDSFSMAGIDDYYIYNRNWLGKGVGFDRCISLIEKLNPTHIIASHIKEAFDFTPEECRFMRGQPGRTGKALLRPCSLGPR